MALEIEVTGEGLVLGLSRSAPSAAAALVLLGARRNTALEAEVTGERCFLPFRCIVYIGKHNNKGTGGPRTGAADCGHGLLFASVSFAPTLPPADGPNDEGEMFERPGKVSDKLPAPYMNEVGAAQRHACCACCGRGAEQAAHACLS